MSYKFNRICFVLTLLVALNGSLQAQTGERPEAPEASKFAPLRAHAQPKTSPARDVKIYLWEVNSDAPGIPLKPVVRRVLGPALLRLTLQMLFAGATADEEAKGLSSPTFGMQFEDVQIRKGVALVKFSQPAGATNYGSQGPMVFEAAIEKTARQFASVKRVKVCALGETLIDSQLERPFPRCPK